MSNSPIFVFGSNLAGRHGAGAAYRALRYYGAKQGVGIGHIGNSYAIPTKDRDLKPLDKEFVEHNIKGFIAYARSRPDLTFYVTQVGCGLAGFKAQDIAPLFRAAPQNCYFDPEWRPYFNDPRNY